MVEHRGGVGLWLGTGGGVGLRVGHSEWGLGVGLGAGGLGWVRG